jgi:hypothetical protein
LLTDQERRWNMATRNATERDLGTRAERVGDQLVGRHDETKWSLLTTEFWAMVVVVVATLIAAAVADNFDAPRAWLIVGIVATGYIVSRGLAKAGTRHHDDARGHRERV